MNPELIPQILSKIKSGPSKWELDTIVWYDRLTNPDTLVKFLNRIQELSSVSDRLSFEETQELEHLLELLENIKESDVEELINRTENQEKNSFIDELAKKSAIELITTGKMSFETMNTSCKLTPNDFVLCAKRTQDLMNSIRGLVIKGETLSKDVAGA
jgi:hypothetical protein